MVGHLTIHGHKCFSSTLCIYLLSRNCLKVERVTRMFLQAAGKQLYAVARMLTEHISEGHATVEVYVEHRS